MLTDEDDLYDILSRLTEENIKSLAFWVSEHYQPRPVAGSSDKLLRNLKSLAEKLHEPEPLPWGKKHEIYWQGVLEYFTKEIVTYYAEGWCPIKVDYRNQYLWRTEVEKAIDGILEAKLRGTIPEKRELYETYLKDPESLIEALLEVVSGQFNDRLLRTKIAIAKYVEPHKVSYSKVLESLARISVAIEQLRDDPNVTDEDKCAMIGSLEARHSELLEIKKAELANMRNTKAFLDEIRRAQLRFRTMLELLAKKRDEVRARKDYVAFINSMDVKVPQLRDTFKELSQGFASEMQEMKDSFAMLSLSFKGQLIGSLEDHHVLTSILGTSGKGVAERIASEIEVLSRQELTNSDIDVSFLDEYFVAIP